MNTCMYLRDPYCMVWECVVCHRRIREVDRLDVGDEVLMRACGEPSEYDIRLYIEGHHDRYHVRLNSIMTGRRVPQPPPIIPPYNNELIGQEGGKWDAFYLEEAD